jgi:5,10-methylenetetrahydromethanopterin reductase
VAFGTGFTARRAMGQGGLSWDFVRRYVEAFRDLIRGETTEWEGSHVRLLDSPTDLRSAAVDVPILIAAMGPRGAQVASSMNVDGLMSFGVFAPGMMAFDWSVLFVGGTVIGQDEAIDSDRVRAAAGPAWALAYHVAMDFQGGLDAVRTLPGGTAWAQVVGSAPENQRHFCVHQGHLMELNAADRAAWNDGGHVLVPEVTLTGTPEQLRQRIAQLSDQGVTEIGYQPAGPDIVGELKRFKEVVQDMIGSRIA